ncbi:NUDIX domain-containing protein [Bacillus sp. Bva_UNVM-123]|uniref:NUDIX hydrolase n=1 Tax=Bacillus sp. Bva_UNVM-123 TaxID=2829798 RepID=UPI00391F66D7
MQIEFYPIGTIKEDELTFAVICAIYQGKWIYVRHKERNSWEIPGGHREQGESIVATAERELFEETGATKYKLTPICDYSVDNLVNKQFGRLFLAKVSELGPLPHSEIGELSLFDALPENLTHAEIQPYLLEKTVEFLKMGEFIVD